MNLFVKKEDGSSGAFIIEEQNQIIESNDSTDELDVKEDPLQDDSVSKFWYWSLGEL